MHRAQVPWHADCACTTALAKQPMPATRHACAPAVCTAACSAQSGSAPSALPVLTPCAEDLSPHALPSCCLDLPPNCQRYRWHRPVGAAAAAPLPHFAAPWSWRLSLGRQNRRAIRRYAAARRRLLVVRRSQERVKALLHGPLYAPTSCSRRCHHCQAPAAPLTMRPSTAIASSHSSARCCCCQRGHMALCASESVAKTFVRVARSWNHPCNVMLRDHYMRKRHEAQTGLTLLQRCTETTEFKHSNRATRKHDHNAVREAAQARYKQELAAPCFSYKATGRRPRNHSNSTSLAIFGVSS